MCCAPIMRPLPTTLAVHSAPHLLGPVLPPRLPATAAGVTPPSKLCPAGLPVLARKGENLATMLKQAAQALWGSPNLPAQDNAARCTHIHTSLRRHSLHCSAAACPFADVILETRALLQGSAFNGGVWR